MPSKALQQVGLPSVLAIYALAMSGFAACSGNAGSQASGNAGHSGGGKGGTAGIGGAGGASVAFEPVAPNVALAKVKGLLTGLAPTDDEIAAFEKDPGALKAMVDAWFVTPQAQAKLFAFFKNAFQQTQITETDLVDQGMVNNVKNPILMSAVTEMFARTAMKLIVDGKPFTDVLTTHTYMMTPALMSLYLLTDQTLRSDTEVKGISIPGPDGTLQTKLKAYATFIPPAVAPAVAHTITVAEVFDPNSPYYLHFPIDKPFDCPVSQVDATGHVMLDATGKPLTVNMPYNERVYDTTDSVFALLLGTAVGGNAETMYPASPPLPADAPAKDKPFYGRNPGCVGNKAIKSMLTADDSIWRPVTVRAPSQNEKMVAFYDLPALRQANELVLRTPRVGFFTTPAFFANWQTNKSNQSRNVTNQALIVALGRSINPVDSGPVTILDTGKDGQHSDPNSPCYGCHQILDPMRQVFAKSFTYSYHRQENAAQKFATATFKLEDTQTNLDSLDQLGTTLAASSLFPVAWAQKLCYYANSSSCSEDDPEFMRVSDAFREAHFDFHVLVRELFSSPLITGVKATKTWQEKPEVVTIARQDHLCAALTNRLKLQADLCGSITNKTAAQVVSNNIPSDGYLRGAEAPVLSTDPTMFFRGAAETICQLAADQVVDIKGTSLYTSGQKDAAITGFVATVMGIGSKDPLSASATKILQDHYAAAVAKGATPTVALKSTFTVACTSPSSIAIGL